MITCNTRGGVGVVEGLKAGVAAFLKVICFTFVALILLAHFSDAQAYQIKRVLRGSVSFGADDAVVLADLTSQLGGVLIDTNKAFITISTNINANYPSDHLFSVKFDDAQTLLIQRGIAVTAATVNYEVVEFVDGVTVTHGSTAMSDTTYTKVVTLPVTVDLSRSFPVISRKFGLRLSGGPQSNSDENTIVTAELTATNQMTLKRDDTASKWMLEVFYQIVAFDDDINVQHNTLQIAGGSLSNTATLNPAVDVTKSALFFTTRAGSSTAGDERDYAVRGELTDAQTLTFTRVDSSDTADIAWYLIEFKDGSLVQKSSASTSTTTATGSLTDSVDTTRAFNFFSVSGGSSATSVDEIFVASYLTGVSRIDFARGGTGSTINIPWFVAELPPLKVTAPNSASDIWKVGETKNITWKHANALVTGGTGPSGHHKVTIYISTNGGADGYPDILSSDTDADGVADSPASGLDGTLDTYAWTIPKSIASKNLR